ncbi:MAG: hypothetical protein A2X34_07100 [Elusimicrobia bacterium GWC2_51_8]|nr:MAG: hypothetical protein A2X33_05870 [Elusimicrobia bacterium GWA2_51_34]OGR62669.1 MAG: hypothetical protein A2X34_07100 [Elusimicrobia bacterium GWC2_51_8]OGR88174.1 MAG: hypothetical protein A2021_01015 [Elusimicrobia bacterium GWF2_52_66]HAF95377.1 hypothetical protein [Elusimicrobiota bacterium]HCE98759.1 hypothetical protein [Elusimicrobiota bacterium]
MGLITWAFMKKRILVSQVITLAVLVLSKPDSPKLFVAGFVIMLFGQTIRLLSSAAIVKSKTLTTSGPYAAVRNPLYLGTAFMTLGLLLMLSSPRHPILTAAVWGVTLASYLWIYSKTMKSEEEFLSSVYGPQFEAYKKAVPALAPRPADLKYFFDASAYSPEVFRKNKEWRGFCAGLALAAFVFCRIKYDF